MSHTYLQFPASPNLPLAPDVWNAQYQNQFANVLRLYFNQISVLLQQLSGRQGGYHLSFPHGAIQRTTDLTFTANTPTLVTFDQNDYLLGMSNDGTDGITVDKAGIYNYQFSVQFANTDTKIQTAYLWLRKNGTDVPGTASKFDVPSSHAGGDGYLIGAANFYIDLAAGDYVSMYIGVTDALLYIEAYAAQTSPFAHPSIPSAVATLSFVSAPSE